MVDPHPHLERRTSLKLLAVADKFGNFSLCMMGGLGGGGGPLEVMQDLHEMTDGKRLGTA